MTHRPPSAVAAVAAVARRLLVLEGERPVSWNSYYAGKHWTYRSREAQRVHDLVRSQIDYRDRPFDVPVRVTVTAYFKNKPLDSCNIPAKMYVDGLLVATAENRDGFRAWLWDDGPKWVVSTMTVPRVDRDRPRVEILVEECDGDN